MPSLTRLAAALLFAAASIYLGEQYKLLYERPPSLGRISVLLGVVGAYAGWTFVGPRIKGKLVADITQAVQGVILTVFLALGIYGLMEVMYQGYKIRYSGIPDAVVGFFNLTGAHVIRMTDQNFLINMAVTVAVVGIVLSIVYRWAERRRFA